MLTISNPTAIAFGLDLHKNRARLVRLHPAELLTPGLSDVRSFGDLPSFRCYWTSVREQLGWPGPGILVGVQQGAEDPYGVLTWLCRQNVDVQHFDVPEYDRAFCQEFEQTRLTVHHRKAYALAITAAYRLNPDSFVQTLSWQLNRVRQCLSDLEYRTDRLYAALRKDDISLDDWNPDDVPF